MKVFRLQLPEQIASKLQNAAGASRRGSTGPIAWAPLLMCYRDDYDLSLAGSIKNIEGKPLKNALACAVIGNGKGIWNVFDSGYGVLDILRECESAQWTAFEIPITRGVKFGASIRGEA